MKPKRTKVVRWVVMHDSYSGSGQTLFTTKREAMAELRSKRSSPAYTNFQFWLEKTTIITETEVIA